MRYFFGEERKQILKQYKKEILIRFAIASGIYLFGVVMAFIFKTREAMYLIPIILGIWSTFYIAYLFYFILMYLRNYKGNHHFIENYSSGEYKYHHAKAIGTDSIVYNMYGVFCHSVQFLSMDTKTEFTLFVPMENLEEFKVNQEYNLESYRSVVTGYEEMK